MSGYHTYSISPHSSSGQAESTGGTPDTRLTAFSPDDPRSLVRPTNAISSGTALNEGQNDPFVTSYKSGLSATASTFQPYSIRVSQGPAIAHGSVPIPGTAQYLNKIIADSTPPRVPQPAEITQQGTFTTDTAATRYIKVSGIYGQEVQQDVQISLDKLQETFTRKGSIRVEAVGKVVYIRLANIFDAAVVYRAVKQEHVDFSVEYISSNNFGHVISPQSKAYSAHEGQVILIANYPQHREIKRNEFEKSLRSLLAVEGPLCAWQKLSATEAGTFKMVAEFADSSLAPRAVSRLNGKQIGTPQSVAVSVTLHTPDVTSTAHRATPLATPTRSSGESFNLADTLSRMTVNDIQGPRFSGTIVSPQGPPTMTYIPGNSPFGLPSNAVPIMMPGLYTHSPVSPPLAQQQYLNRQSPFGGNVYNHFSPYNNHPSNYSTSLHHPGFQAGFQQPNYNHDYSVFGSLSNGFPTGDGFSPSNGHHIARSAHSVVRRENGPRAQSGYRTQPQGRRQSNSAAGHHNHVDIQRIQLGTDVRTTVMLRNIPNKVDQGMLKDIIDESSFGKYDFMYLRIDFSNNCNVGYAFINFTDPMDIVDFVVARANHRWEKFKSDKVAEVSYATIQGRDCLIQKFRNSSVMLEPPHYRPKLFFTTHDSYNRAGQEDEFPSSDNASKLKRSCENAEHVGLFAPNAGQHLRDEQRRRRSQYDRGTSLAEREDFGFDDGQMSSYYGGGYSPPRY